MLPASRVDTLFATFGPVNSGGRGCFETGYFFRGSAEGVLQPNIDFAHSELKSSETSPQTFRSKTREKGSRKIGGERYSDFGQSLPPLFRLFTRAFPMNSISVPNYLQDELVVCPQCGLTVRVAHDLCLRCMLFLGIATYGDTSETLDDLFSEIGCS